MEKAKGELIWRVLSSKSVEEWEVESKESVDRNGEIVGAEEEEINVFRIVRRNEKNLQWFKMMWIFIITIIRSSRRNYMIRVKKSSEELILVIVLGFLLLDHFDPLLNNFWVFIVHVVGKFPCIWNLALPNAPNWPIHIPSMCVSPTQSSLQLSSAYV